MAADHGVAADDEAADDSGRGVAGDPTMARCDDGTRGGGGRGGGGGRYRRWAADVGGGTPAKAGALIMTTDLLAPA